MKKKYRLASLEKSLFRDLITDVSEYWIRTGSRVICDPAPDDTDDDYLLLGDMMLIESSLKSFGFKKTCDDTYDGGSFFSTFRYKELNVIVTDSEVFFDRFEAATLLAKQKNILNKDDRIAFFKRVLYAPIPNYHDNVTNTLTSHEINYQKII